MFLPEVKAVDGKTEIDWKIWVLSTRLESLDIQMEDESLLQNPGKDMGALGNLETEVFIIGGGNAYVVTQRIEAIDDNHFFFL